jgi:hypothetical protein
MTLVSSTHGLCRDSSDIILGRLVERFVVEIKMDTKSYVGGLHWLIPLTILWGVGRSWAEC